MIMIPAIIAVAVVNIFDGSTSLDTTIADRGSWNFVAEGLSDDTHSFAATGRDTAGNTSAASQSESKTVVPSITSFSSTPKTRFSIGGDSYEVQDAGQSYSLTNPDPQTLRFELHPGDQAWYDAGHAVDRDEIASDVVTPAGTPLNIRYQFMVEPNGPNGSFVNTTTTYPSGGGFFVVGQLHNDDWAMGSGISTSPPFSMTFTGSHLGVDIKYCPTGLNPNNGAGNTKTITLWTDPNPIQAGVYHNIQIQTNMLNTSSGYLQVWVDGTKVVNYNGPIGYGAGTLWEYGLYRSSAPETTAVDYRNMTLTTGSR
jgi:hypothetical protein